MWVVHRAERADRLADALAEVIGGPAADPFVPEIVAVPERGVERWLGQRLAHRLGTAGGRGGEADGVCANVLFPPPGQVLAEAVDAATGTDPETDPWHPARAVWPLLEEVVAAVEAPGETFAALAAHLSQSGGSRTYAVARRLADLFAGYAVHRPDMLRAWWAGSPEGVPQDLRWQVELWRRLRARIGVPGPAERLEQAERVLRADPGLVELPERLSVFGPTRLAAEHLAVLSALAQHREVHLWLPHPSPALWEKLSPAQGAAVPRREDHSADAVVNPLLRSLGRDVRELQLRLPAGVADVHHPADPAPVTLLGRLQENLREDRLPAGELPLLDPADRSVQVHACHGPDRQVEVLREIVLGLLAADPTLEPRDVIVMCPDIEAFAPLISASFGLAAALPDAAAGPDAEDTHPGHRLRVRLADRALRQANPLLGTVSALLELADSRVAASQVLDLVGSAPVRRRFRLDDDALDRIGELVVRAGVRWGLDGEHRRPFKLDGFPQNTWSAGLDRMLLGVAMAERPGEQGWLGTALPLDDVDSSDVDLVGSLAEILDRLQTTLAALAGPQPLTAWIAALLDGLSALTATTASEAWQDAQARAELAEVVRSAGPQGATVPLTLSDVRGLLADRLRGRPSRANFRTGTLTVATLVPMRSVPHRVVCLLGVDDGVFPRTGAPDGDDVLARDPRVGERDPRSEDRQLLLDALTAATEHLVVVHSGMNERTGADRPPAVPIGELLDAVDATVRVPDGSRFATASEAITVRHPLQPFDPRNFTPELTAGTGPFSFDRNALAGARALQGERRAAPPFLAAPLAPAEAGDTVELDDLVRFLEHPIKAFLRQRVGMVPRSEDEEPADALPVSLTGLDEWAVGDRMLRDRLAGAPAEHCVQAEWRRGELPPGALGGAVLEKVGGAVEPLVEASRELRTGEPVSRDVAADLGGLRVVGTVAGLYGHTLVTVEYSRLGPKHRLRAWARLLALTVTRPDTPWRAVTLGRGRGGGAMRATIRPLGADEATTALADLVALHREGLREPLPVSTPCTAAYAKARRAGAAARDAELAAAKEWTFEKEDEAIVAVLGADPEFELLLAQQGVVESRFGELAERIWRPLLDAEHVELL
ncbi:exodeoxyribonuclease V subunit gamma [Pseudonocardia kujensis]|uniref:exodeoxyribonuclease V subunit gamma n=1 Tax=Pseudonocardia kujensis TaxID=1128675 RepID=UPI001E3CF726|nr:exodeoxyribonuclease V subunit gamma [Pseudonocardia kujensis]